MIGVAPDIAFSFEVDLPPSVYAFGPVEGVVEGVFIGGESFDGKTIAKVDKFFIDGVGIVGPLSIPGKV